MIFHSFQTIADTEFTKENIFETTNDDNQNNIFDERPQEVTSYKSQNLFNENNQENTKKTKEIFGENLENKIKNAFTDYYKGLYDGNKQNLRILFNKIKNSKNSNENNNKFYDIINEFHIPIYCFISTVKLDNAQTQENKDILPDCENVPIFLAPYIITDIFTFRLQLNIVQFLSGNFKNSINFQFQIFNFLIIEYNFLLNLYENAEYLLFPSFFIIKNSLEKEARQKFKEAREGFVILLNIIRFLDYYLYVGFQAKFFDILLCQKTEDFAWQFEIAFGGITTCYFYSNYINIFFLDQSFKFHLERLTLDVVISNVLLWLLQIKNYQNFKLKVCFYDKTLGVAFELSIGTITIVLILLEKGLDQGGMILSFKFNNFYLDDCIRSSINFDQDIITHKNDIKTRSLELNAY